MIRVSSNTSELSVNASCQHPSHMELGEFSPTVPQKELQLTTSSKKPGDGHEEKE